MSEIIWDSSKFVWPKGDCKPAGMFKVATHTQLIMINDLEMLLVCT